MILIGAVVTLTHTPGVGECAVAGYDAHRKKYQLRYADGWLGCFSWDEHELVAVRRVREVADPPKSGALR